MNESSKKSPQASAEEQVLSFWNTHSIFQKSLEKDSPQGNFVFYDGPPFATGLPHYGHLLTGTIKDIIPRYKTMQGYHVDRTWGWDCHGLPIENLIEKELGLATKKEILDYGIDKFNQAARDSVLRYESEWKRYVPRSGRWIDMENPYMSMQPTYMESVWHIFHQLYEKGLTKEGFKPMHLCPRCETTLANFEVNQGYQDVKDISVTAKFELLDEPGTYVLAWTTTPWTLPGNAALGVGTDIDYVTVAYEDAKYIVAKELLESVFEGNSFEIISEYKGSALVGKSYKPVFDFYANQDDLENRENGWKIYGAPFVTTEDGTGIVHLAPAFGSDDMELGAVENLPFIQHVAKNGAFVDDFAKTVDGESFMGMLVKKKDDHMTTDIEIIKRLAADENLFSKKKLVHSYPHCWRCDTPLLNYATGSWYVDAPSMRERLLKHNEGVNWVPDHVGSGRFGKWLDGARDWALSRSRFWGTPLPVWKTADESETFVPGSIASLLERVETSGNDYFGIRHGQSQSNVDGVVNAVLGVENGLTDLGKEQIQDALKDIPSDIDYIFVSPFQRTQETAEIIKKHLDLSDENYIVDDRLFEIRIGESWEGKLWADAHHAEHGCADDCFLDSKLAEDAESIRDVYKRVVEFMFELEEKYKNKKILIVSHGGVLKALQFGVKHYGQSSFAESFYREYALPKNGDLMKIDFKPFPHGDDYSVDLHRPYIDELKVTSTTGEIMHRVEDVFDVWFDSGSMPYAQTHYPFENADQFEGTRFPAQFIAEGLDQTRGWFYVMLVLGTALFDRSPYENVIVNGLILAEDGKKMSKSLQNYPDPYELFDSIGADAIRLYMIASPVVRGEEFVFSEKAAREVSSKVMGRLRNVMSLYKTYKDETEHTATTDSAHVLDQWIVNRVYELEAGVRHNLDQYELDRAARYIFDFVDDFSTWYVRRSRDRYKTGDKNALATTRFVFHYIARVIAPFVPFVAEDLWQSLREDDNNLEMSVHLAHWPEAQTIDEKNIAKMAFVRELISSGLQLRSEAKIKVRQPLASFTITDTLAEEYQELIRAEMNVKQIITGRELGLDTQLTDELILEGNMREFLRSIQSLRKKSGLDAHDMITLIVDTNDAGKSMIETFADDIKETAGISEFIWQDNQGEEVLAGELKFTCSIQ
jgi:isoleucyl-tRNA synthetase